MNSPAAASSGSLVIQPIGLVPRRRRRTGCAVLSILCSLSVIGDRRLTADDHVLIQFGSCIKQEQPTPIFRRMLNENAKLVLFLGDNIYADTVEPGVMRLKYQRLAANPLFQRVRRSATVMATWDDHDFGVNDGGAEFPIKTESQQEFLRFWGVPRESPRWDRAGVYHTRTLGPPGKRIQILMLDTRYFRSELAKGPPRVGGPYVPDDSIEKSMLGDQQWQWLETQLRKPAEVRIVGSSIQFVAEAAGQECWSNLPRERQRMIDLIRETKASGVIFVSGDRHWAELSKVDIGYPLYDLTSSSFNQKHGRGTPTNNRHRAIRQTYHRENYGVISVDWVEPVPRVGLEIRTLDGATPIKLAVPLNELQFAERTASP